VVESIMTKATDAPGDVGQGKYRALGLSCLSESWSKAYFDVDDEGPPDLPFAGSALKSAYFQCFSRNNESLRSAYSAGPNQS
jgi:hypothetical protein